MSKSFNEFIEKNQKFLKKQKNLFKKKKGAFAKVDQLRYLSQSALIEETTTPYIVRATLITISTTIMLLIIWAGFTNIEEIALTKGEVIPGKHVQLIQHLEGGIISKINVSEGDLVTEGETLIVLDGDSIKQDILALKARKLSLDYESLKLKSFINNTKPDFSSLKGDSADKKLLSQEHTKSFNSMIDAKQQEGDVITQQISQKESSLIGLKKRNLTLKDSLKLAHDEKELKSTLNKKGHLSKVALINIKKQFNEIKLDLQENESEISQVENSISEYKNRLESLEANFVDNAYKELHIVNANLAQVEENLTKLQNQADRLEIKSTSYGFVKVLNIKTIGGVIGSGKILAEIVPLDGKLILEVQIEPENIGNMKVGQQARVKISSYDFSRYGTIEGVLEYISPTTFVDADNSKHYIGRVSLSKNYVGNNPKKNLILPGMTVQADIVMGGKSILSYLLKPIYDSTTTAFTEK